VYVCTGTVGLQAKVISYTKSFVDNPSNEFELQKDSNLDREMTTLRFRRCFVGLLIKSYHDFQMGGRVENEPEEVNAAKAVWLGSDDKNNIIAKFLEKYEITDNKDDFVKSSEIENWTVVNKDISYRKLCQELKKILYYS
jgi:hypothetical protein